MKSIQEYRMSNPSKKGQLNLLTTGILTLAVAAIILVISLVILQQLRDTQTNGTVAFLSANKTLVAQGQFGDFWTIIVLAVVAAVVIGIILTTFGGAGRR